MSSMHQRTFAPLSLRTRRVSATSFRFAEPAVESEAPASAAFAEPRAGRDFSHVRLHADAPASGLGAGLGIGLASRAPAGILQRDLATPPPATPAAAQPALTPAQIKDAIDFNSARYDEANTRLIQRLLGGPVTGKWTDENIEAIAATQETYGLTKDGKVGPATFQFLDREQRLERMSRRTEDCLVSFNLIGPGAQQLARGDATHCRFRNNFAIEARFSPRCSCAQFEYRQFIRGHLRRNRAGVVSDLPLPMPGGILPAAWTEDEDVTAAVPRYGHRNEPASTAPVDHYMDAAGADDQANGCRYRAEDGPGGIVDDCLPGDSYDLFMTFRGEIQRGGAAIQRKFWTAFNVRGLRP